MNIGSGNALTCGNISSGNISSGNINTNNGNITISTNQFDGGRLNLSNNSWIGEYGFNLYIKSDDVINIEASNLNVTGNINAGTKTLTCGNISSGNISSGNISSGNINTNNGNITISTNQFDGGRLNLSNNSWIGEYGFNLYIKSDDVINIEASNLNVTGNINAGTKTLTCGTITTSGLINTSYTSLSVPSSTSSVGYMYVLKAIEVGLANTNLDVFITSGSSGAAAVIFASNQSDIRNLYSNIPIGVYMVLMNFKAGHPNSNTQQYFQLFQNNSTVTGPVSGFYSFGNKTRITESVSVATNVAIPHSMACAIVVTGSTNNCLSLTWSTNATPASFSHFSSYLVKIG